MNLEETCKILSNLANRSNGELIKLDSGRVARFRLRKKYSSSELTDFEKSSKLRLSNEYKFFLQTVGSCECYLNEGELGIVFLQIEEIKSYTDENYSDYLEASPGLVIVMENTLLEDVGAFHEQQGSKFTVIPHDEAIDEWLESDDNWIRFDDWLEHLVTSDGIKCMTYQ